MKVAVIGGRLQGVEACYLALALGWDVFLVDRDPSVPATGLKIPFYQIDLANDSAEFRKVIRGADLIIPALENVSALKSLERQASTAGVPLAYDPESYLLSRSKKRSNQLLARLGVPIPSGWPESGFPVIAKPSTGSGSKGVKKLCNRAAMRNFFRGSEIPPGWVVQEFLEGPSYSLEVFGCEDYYQVAQITELEMDSSFDCERVLAPAKISPLLAGQMEELTLKIARELKLEGIMDVEVIEHRGVLKVLEIDARLPSQTPTAVLHSTGINMLDILGRIFTRKELPRLAKNGGGVIYEHVRVESGRVEFAGEHIMSTAGPLKKLNGFFGADVALTNFSNVHSPWVATLITTGKNREEAWQKRCRTIGNIKRESAQA